MQLKIDSKANKHKMHTWGGVFDTDVKISLSSMCRGYINLFFIYITFEVMILNFISDISSDLLAYVRYGMEGLGYVLLLSQFCFNKDKKIHITKFDQLIFLTIIVSVVSSVINGVSLNIFVIGFRYLLRYYYIYLLIRISGWTLERIERFYKYLRGVMAIQIFLVVWQLLSRGTADAVLAPRYGEIVENINSTITRITSKFAVYGSLGRYNLFGYFAVLAIWYWIAELITDSSNKKKARMMLLIWCVLLIVSFSRQSIVAIFMTYIIFIFIRKKISVRQLFLLVAVMLVSMLLIINAVMSFNIASNYTQTGVGVVSGSLYERYVSMFSLDFLKIDFEGRGRTWFITEGILRLLSKNPVFGYGIGMYGCPDTLRMNTYVYELLNIPTTYYMDVYIGCIIGQIGLVGFFVYMAAYTNLLKISKKVFKSNSVSPERIKIAIITFGVILSTLVMMMFSSSLCNRVMALYVWMFIGFQSIIERTRLQEP